MAHRLAHLLLDSLATSIVLATATVAGLVWFDVMEMGRLTRNVEGGQVALWLLWGGLLGTFAPAAAAVSFALAASRDGEG